MRVNKSKIVLIAATVACALLYVLWSGFSNWSESSNFGKEQITLPNGSKVYFVHEQWGLHSSGNEISVTLNPDGCMPPNPATDYIDTYGDGETIAYSVTPHGLILYEQFDPAVSMHEPSTPWPDINVSVQKRRDLDDLLRDPNSGVKILRVPLNEVCWKNFFRKAGTSLRNGR
ncbi:MAG TPA: hypothetical protein VN310_10530 [Candidatus Dormibacteraeota bacterium]|jgi:hypothetical protein|nr:hypothetical protein [Candidatus Dormibacteraeota bacterium]